MREGSGLSSAIDTQFFVKRAQESHRQEIHWDGETSKLVGGLSECRKPSGIGVVSGPLLFGAKGGKSGSGRKKKSNEVIGVNGTKPKVRYGVELRVMGNTVSSSRQRYSKVSRQSDSCNLYKKRVDN